MSEEHQSGLTGAAGRAAFFPARAAARIWRDQLEMAVDDVLSAPQIARVVDRALAGPLPEAIARSVVRHRVLERVVDELALSGELERLLGTALASPSTLELTDRVLASDGMQHALRHVASSPEMREAMSKQTRSLAEEVVEDLRARTVKLDDRAEEIVRRRRRADGTRYAGIATRSLALATDVLLTIALYMSVVGVVALVALLVGGLRPEWLVGVLLGVGWVALGAAYFGLFWSTTGQTPGMRLFRLRVRTRLGAKLSLRRSLVRWLGLVISIVPMFAGFVPVLFDERRRGLADLLAGTVVMYDDASLRVPD